MLLVIDVGNSNTVLGIYHERQLIHDWRIATDKQGTLDEYAVLVGQLLQMAGVNFDGLKAVVVSCVVPSLLGTIDGFCQKYLRLTPLVVGPGIKTGMPIHYDNPNEVGADRIVNAVAAYEQFRCALVVVDFGTATTFDVISAAGCYEGGAIAPGIGISSDALFNKTSKLPRVDFLQAGQIIAKNTINSIQSGIFYGYLGLVEGMIGRIKKEMSADLKVVATGGFAASIAAATKTIDRVEPFLTLEGLRLLYELNQT